jgi:hypothetical protein
MEVIRSSKTSVHIRITRRYVPVDNKTKTPWSSSVIKGAKLDVEVGIRNTYSLKTAACRRS